MAQLKGPECNLHKHLHQESPSWGISEAAVSPWAEDVAVALQSSTHTDTSCHTGSTTVSHYEHTLKQQRRGSLGTPEQKPTNYILKTDTDSMESREAMRKKENSELNCLGTNLKREVCPLQH